MTEKAIVFINGTDGTYAYGTVLVGMAETTIADDLDSIGDKCDELGFPSTKLVGLLVFEGRLYSGDVPIAHEDDAQTPDLDRRGTYRRLTPDEAVRFANGEDVL